MLEIEKASETSKKIREISMPFPKIEKLWIETGTIRWLREMEELHLKSVLFHVFLL